MSNEGSIAVLERVLKANEGVLEDMTKQHKALGDVIPVLEEYISNVKKRLADLKGGVKGGVVQ